MTLHAIFLRAIGLTRERAQLCLSNPAVLAGTGGLEGGDG